ncbi:MAG: hypothetical protein M9962_05305 [Oligoflexia bacterium]|nr:hypothetical protein [Oligoflexia bacterium]
MKYLRKLSLVCLLLLLASAKIDDNYDEQKISDRIDKEVPVLMKILENPKLIEKIKSQNESLPKILHIVSNKNWKNYNGSSDVIKFLEKNELAKELRELMPFYVSEFFVSDMNGKKVLFFEKTTWFDHSKLEKYLVPKKGSIWKGKMERDESSGIHQVQVGLPVRDKNKIIGVATFGLSIVRLEDTIESTH